MNEQDSTGSVCTTTEVGAELVVFEVQAKYLNYDVSDGLKLQLCDEVEQCIGRGRRTFVLDLTKVSIVDSCGVGMMISLHNFAKEQGGRLVLCGLTSFLAKIFRMMHLDQYFETVSSIESLQTQPVSE